MAAACKGFCGGLGDGAGDCEGEEGEGKEVLEFHVELCLFGSIVGCV